MKKTDTEEVFNKIQKDNKTKKSALQKIIEGLNKTKTRNIKSNKK